MRIEMRKPCQCGETEGVMRTVNGQDVVRCSQCNTFQYNAPKTETGRAPRTVQTTHAAIKPKQRYRIIERAGAKCELCGSQGNIHVGHVVSVEAGHKLGLSDADINADENLIATCDECNLGMGNSVLPIRVLVSILKLRAENTDHGDS